MSVYDIVLQQITAKLESGVVPWHQTWKSGALPMNYVTRKQYRGINIVLLAGNPYTSPYYLSFKQVNQRGGRIGSGEPGHPVVFYKPVADRDDGETSYMVMRFYRVWNIQQTTLAIPETDSIHTRPAGLSLMDGMPDKPQIVHGQVNPCYIPSEDRILLPPVSAFDGEEEYQAALFHELVHSTGHERRLLRFAKDARALLGSDSYSEEELVAEIGASFLCGRAGILPKTIDNNAAYIHSWLEAIRRDKRIFIRAASAAQRAVDYITGERPEAVTDIPPTSLDTEQSAQAA
jgi:antirestriction protein ArdC